MVFPGLFLLGILTFALWDSNLKTKKSASGKRPPDEAPGSGDETIRPQRSSEAERSSEKKVHNARCADSASRGIAQHSKFQPNFVKLFRTFTVLLSKIHRFF